MGCVFETYRHGSEGEREGFLLEEKREKKGDVLGRDTLSTDRR